MVGVCVGYLDVHWGCNLYQVLMVWSTSDHTLDHCTGLHLASSEINHTRIHSYVLDVKWEHLSWKKNGKKTMPIQVTPFW